MIIAAGKFHGVIAAQTPTPGGSPSGVYRRRGGDYLAVGAFPLFGKPLDKRGGIGDFAFRFRQRLCPARRSRSAPARSCFSRIRRCQFSIARRAGRR
ncbi:hypothetical protein LNP74_25050 [Klebsiella pneumoniae subsp. pneumoniae]|nr:hypothetical protein [Klebsiella pneumoniae subsp. pneumoniae]